MLTDIQQDAEWLIHMVENLLSITRIDSGRVKIIKTPIIATESVGKCLYKA